MRIKSFQTVRPPIGAFDAIESHMVAVFRREFYLPLIAELGGRGKLVLNSYDSLVRAIASGRLQWVDGHIEGPLTAELSGALRDAGATWDRGKKRWKFPTELLTPDIRMAIGEATSSFKKVAQKIDSKLERFTPDVVSGKMNLAKIFDATLFRVDRRLSESIKDITVTPKITEDERKTITENYTKDMSRYIKDWTKEQITKLRERVQEESLSGARYDSLARIIQYSYGESRNKAAFLARQETNLFLSEFKQTRYTRAGIDSYTWMNVAGSPNHPVRPDHAELNKTIQRWDSPPVTNKKTGARNHPGCDFGCRCYDRPFIKF